jgi:hypothetical protein
VSLTLLQAETEVRILTRHESDTVRVSQSVIRTWLHHEYRALRSWLQDVAPQLYLQVSGAITIAEGDEIQLTSALVTFERMMAVEYDAGDDDWREMERSSPLAPNRSAAMAPLFRVEGNRLRFGPDDIFSGDVRVKYWITPATLSTDGALFEIPVQLEHPLILRACGWVATKDSKDNATSKKDFDAMADVLLYGKDGNQDAPKPGSAMAVLKGQTGIHPHSQGLRRVARLAGR